MAQQSLEDWLKSEVRIKDNDLDKYIDILDDELGVGDLGDFEFFDADSAPWYYKDGDNETREIANKWANSKGLKLVKLKKLSAKAEEVKQSLLAKKGGNAGGASAMSAPVTAKDEWATWNTQDVINWVNTLSDNISDIKGCLKYIQSDNLNGKLLIQMIDSGKNSLGCSSKQGKYVIFGKLQEYQVCIISFIA